MVSCAGRRSTYMHISFMKTSLMPAKSFSPWRKEPRISMSFRHAEQAEKTNEQSGGTLGPGNPPPQTHTHIKHRSACTCIKTRQLARPQWSTRQSNVSGICSCLVWRVFPTLPPAPAHGRTSSHNGGKGGLYGGQGGRLYSYWGKKDGERGLEC